MRSDEEDSIKITRGPGDQCSADLGMLGGLQTTNFADNCWEMGTQMHEFMHSLGVMHTFTRRDRDQYVDVFIQYVEPSKRFNYDINDYQFRIELLTVPSAFEI